MNVDLRPMNYRPVPNRIVENHFRQFPVYLRNESIQAHWHSPHVQPGIEINVSLAGSAVFVVGERVIETAPGQLLVFPGRIPHQVFVEKSATYRRAVICIDDVSLQRLKESFPHSRPPMEWFGDVDCHRFQLQMKTFAAVKQAAMRMIAELQEQKRGWQQMVFAELLSLVVTVERLVDERTAAPGRLARRRASRELAERCCGHIESHLYEDLSLTSVAARFQVSPEHLTRTFKRETGVAFYQYVLLKRIQESKRLLRESANVSLTEIAYSLGFASSSHFSRTFKSVTRMTPSEYRLGFGLAGRGVD
ncbi:AraC family transcriptional regulator [Paenibacillus sp. GYB003]|uniref:AraC family transcriptional regulator n=1 Tax=Paenibacillus sp. GYB003 TaxID=2994392 RepID=UPI002F960B97